MTSKRSVSRARLSRLLPFHSREVLSTVESFTDSRAKAVFRLDVFYLHLNLILKTSHLAILHNIAQFFGEISVIEITTRFLRQPIQIASIPITRFKCIKNRRQSSVFEIVTRMNGDFRSNRTYRGYEQVRRDVMLHQLLVIYIYFVCSRMDVSSECKVAVRCR